jgi:pyruvate dehydrogenase E2 component (dihydrolipoamide acetyltransferase)
MAVSVVMPALEMAQETGKLVSWLKQEGEHVRKGEMLLEVETDKAVVEIEAGSDGILGGISAKVGDVIPVGQTIAWLLKEGEAPPQTAAAPPQTGRRTDAATPAASVAPVSRPSSGGGQRISPKARKLAHEHGVDLNTIVGSGAGGEILADDILNAAARGKGTTVTAAPSAGSLVEVTSVGRLMAERTTQSWTTVPHFFVTREVDATALNSARQALLPRIEASHGVKVTHSDLIVAAVARALRRQPRMNASWTNGGVTLNPEVNVALAMALDTEVDVAVVTAVIHKADTLSVGEIAVRRRELAERARAGRLQPADIAGGTFTISNLGMFQVDAFTAVIVPPQAGILAVGAIADRAVPVDDSVGIRPMVSLTLSSDHRVVDGLRAAQFLNAVVDFIGASDQQLG